MQTIKRNARVFDRKPSLPGRLTDRKFRILESLYRYRLLDMSHIARLDGGNESNLRGIMRWLFDEGLVLRPENQLAHHRTFGAIPIVYALTKKGFETLCDFAKVHSSGTDWTDRNASLSPSLLLHSLRTTDLLVPLETAVRALPGGQFHDKDDLLVEAPVETRASRNPLRMTARNIKPLYLGHHHSISLIPDGYFGFSWRDESGETRRNVFFLETDMATEQILDMNSGQRRSHIVGKYMAYLAVSGRPEGGGPRHYQEHLGIISAQVLFFTTTPTRRDNMIAAFQEHTGKNGGFYLFQDRETLLSAPNVLDVPWINGRGQEQRLV